MAQKTLTQGAARTGSHKSHKAAPSVEGIAVAEVPGTIPQAARQEYAEVNAAIDRGLADVAAGRVHRRRSYAEYADTEIED